MQSSSGVYTASIMGYKVAQRRFSEQYPEKGIITGTGKLGGDKERLRYFKPILCCR